MPIERIPALLQLSSNGFNTTVGCQVKPVIWTRPLDAQTDGKLLNNPMVGAVAASLGGRLEHWAISFYCLDGAEWKPWFTMEHLGEPVDKAQLNKGDCTFRHGVPIPDGGEMYFSTYALEEFQRMCDQVDEVYLLPTNHCQTFAINVHNAFRAAMTPMQPGTQTDRPHASVN